MRITYLGHAGLFIETRAGSILCDPWFHPAFFASWFPFPSNENVDVTAFAHPDYLYISHEHRDHLDRRFLTENVSKQTTVLLPDYPHMSLERELRSIGFTSFVRTKNAEPVKINGLRIAIVALVAPSDGPEGDSGLIVDDGEACIFNQNDSHPADISGIQALGPFDAHFLQFSGAIWYPMVYRFPAEAKESLGRKKRLNQQTRALAFAKHVNAAHVFPTAGPPCFLDDELFHLNDIGNDPANIFCDQTVFLEYMRANGDDRGHLAIPGTVITLQDGQCSVTHPMSDDDVWSIFKDKGAYLDGYRYRKRRVIEAEKAAWPRGRIDILAGLQKLLEPLLAEAGMTAIGVNARVLLDCSSVKVVVDFLKRRVYLWEGQYCKYRFRIEPALIESCLIGGEADWVNSLFLSCRFEAERDGPYNEYLYNFFKCLTSERLQYAEGYYAEQADEKEFWTVDGYQVQRRCPHLKADLTRFGTVENGVLTCSMHGWQFELSTGRCLTSADCRLYAQRVGEKKDGFAAD
jgi:UDP-MurNAc hydroxylase